MTADSAFWDNIAEKYARKPVEDVSAFERKTALTRALMKPTDVVLDVGCGTGSLALLLAPFAAQVHGLDFSAEMTRIARSKAAAQGITNVSFHTQAFDDRFTVLPEQSLDGLCANSLLHLVDDRAAALAHMFRLIKPGGFFVTSTVCLGESWIPYGPVLTLMRWLGKAPKVTLLSKQMLADDVRRAGFVDLQTPDVGAKPIVGFVIARRPGAPIGV